jgi:hypothetical protein
MIHLLILSQTLSFAPDVGYPQESGWSFFKFILLFCRSGVYMYFSWYFLFKTPSAKYTVNVSIVIFDSCFLYYQLLNLLCGPALIAFSQNGLYLVLYISADNSAGLPLLGLSLNPSIPSSSYLFSH